MKKRKEKLNVGDILSIDLQNGQFAFARVIAKDDLGDVIEVFNHFSNSENEYKNAVSSERLFYPHIIDSYSIFYIGGKGDWNVIEKGDGSCPANDVNDLRFSFSPDDLKLTDIHGNVEKRSEEEMKKFPWHSPHTDEDIRRLIQFWRNKKTNI